MLQNFSTRWHILFAYKPCHLDVYFTYSIFGYCRIGGGTRLAIEQLESHGLPKAN